MFKLMGKFCVTGPMPCQISNVVTEVVQISVRSHSQSPFFDSYFLREKDTKKAGKLGFSRSMSAVTDELASYGLYRFCCLETD